MFHYLKTEKVLTRLEKKEEKNFIIITIHHHHVVIKKYIIKTGVLVDQHLLFRVHEVNKGRGEKKNKDIYNRRERSNNKKREVIVLSLS